MLITCFFCGKSRRIAVYSRLILVAEKRRARPHPDLLHCLAHRQMQKHLRDLHRHAQQEDPIAFLQIRRKSLFTQANPFKYRHIHYLKKNTRIYSE